MKLRLLLGFGFWTALLLTSCNNDNISFDEPTQLLRFSSDTVFCDTVYNQMRSETYAVKVYNKENKDVQIPRISLEGGTNSLYRINVDGKAGTDFTNIPLRKNDSLYVFVEIAPTANAPEAIAEDKVVFQTPAGEQKVTLFSVVQDAEYFIKTDTNQNTITTNTTWTNEKAKIIFGDLTVESGKTLTIEEGTKVYFHKKSGLNISKNAGLTVNGALNKEVVFRGDRNDTRYDTLPANWNGIKMDHASLLNMNYAKIFGGNVGLELRENTATITNTIIHTFQHFGIYAINANLSTNNLVMGNSGEANLGIFNGGTYNLTHSTFANYWDLNPSMPGYAIYVSNGITQESGSVNSSPLHLELKNSIVYSNASNAMFFDQIAGEVFNYKIYNSLLKHGTKSGFEFDGNVNIVNSIKNEEPKFANYTVHKMNFRVKDDSPAKGKGNINYTTLLKDIVGVDRTTPPTIGAYQ